MQHRGDRESETTVWDGCEDAPGQQCAEELHLLLVARRAELATLVRKRQQVLVGALFTANAGEALGEIPAAHELHHDLLDDRT